MPSLTKDTRADLVALLSLNAGQAEVGDPRVIFPVPEHLRALEADVVLVVGDRGAGKTQLFRAFEQEEIRTALVRRAPSIRMPRGRLDWKTGWPLGAQGPDHAAWRNFARTHGGTRDALLSAWYAYLVRILVGYFAPEARSGLEPILHAPAVDVEAAFRALGAASTAATAALDALDERLLREDRWIFVAYDELDTAVLDDWDALGAVVRGVVSLWAAYARRWQRIRPKLFLRSDFYKHHREIAGADVSKLAANRVELQWSDKNLYGALIKHILNKPQEGKALQRHFQKDVPSDSDPILGLIPRLSTALDAKPFVDRLVAEYMGANEKKGLAFTWLLDHLRDGNERALPRTLVWLVEFAAEIERDHPRAGGSHLLHHVSIRNALDRVSRQYVLHATTHEFKWLHGLGMRLRRDRAVPWSRREVLDALEWRFDESWGAISDEAVRPPGQGAEEVLESLVDLGILRARPRSTFDVPDLYLEGLGLKRRGGVAKK